MSEERLIYGQPANFLTTYEQKLCPNSVSLSRTSKGDVSIEVKAYAESVDQAYLAAKALFEQAVKDFPGPTK